MTNAIQKAAAAKPDKKNISINQMVSSILDGEGLRKRFDELLGKRAPQFISSLVSTINTTPQLQQAMAEAPMTVIQAALKAATFDLPIDTSLGYAYIVPFNNTVKKEDGSSFKRMEAAFILGYKGMNQLAMRTGAYKTINVTDVREGELKKYNRLTEDIEIEFVEDEEERDKLPIVGYVGFFRLVNGTEKTIYMTRNQIIAHEKKYRKGQYMGKGWRDDFESMALKTVYRRLIGRWGLMSIDYQTADAKTIAAAEAVATGNFDDESTIDAAFVVDTGTGEIIEENTTSLLN